MPRLPRAMLFVLLLGPLGCAEPPSKEMDRAQGAIDGARAAGAEQFAPAELQSAIDSLRRAERAVAENDYRLALSAAIESRDRAQAATKSAAEARARARGDSERHLAEATAILTNARQRADSPDLARVPRRTAQQLRTAIADSEKSLQEARAALAVDQYDKASAATTAAKTQLQAALTAIDDVLKAPASRRRR